MNPAVCSGGGVTGRSVTWLLAPGCRFAGRLIERTSGKLASVWSPDAMNDAGFMDDGAAFVYPICHGRSSEHGGGDQSYRNRLTHLLISI